MIKVENQLDFVTEYIHGSMNELVAEVSPENHRSEFEYDATYNLLTLKEAVGTADEVVTSFDYDGLAQQVKVVDAEGRVTVHEYDELGRLSQRIRNQVFGLPNSEQNVTTQYEYSPSSALIKVIDANDNATVYDLDELNQVQTITDAENQVTEYIYDAQGNVKEAKNSRQFSTNYNYDKLNRLVEIIDAKDGYTYYNYDANSNLDSIQDANEVVTKYLYNALDRRVEKFANYLPDNAADEQTNVSTKYAYDLHGNLTSVTNPRSYTTTFAYDPAHRNTLVTDPYIHAAEFNYDKEDNVLKITDRNQHANDYHYDNLNRLVQNSNPEDHSNFYHYDKVGNIVEFTNKRGKIFAKQYDPLNRLKVATDPYQNTKEYQHDAIGNILAITDENGHTDEFEFDKVYRLIQSTDAEGNPTERQYDANGNLVKLIDAETNDTDYVYDELDRLIARTNAEEEIEQYAYDKTINLVLKTEADDADHQYSYDPLYRLVQVVNNFKADQDPAADVNVFTQYRYDVNGNLLASIDPLSHQTNFAYDRLDRLTTEINPLNNSWHYSYDFERNLVQRVDANSDTTAYQYYPDDELQTITYPSHRVAYSYSETNYPIQMVDNLGTTTWGYDDLDRVISQTDPFARQLGYEYDAVGNSTKLIYPDGRNVAHQYLKNDWLEQSISSDEDEQTYTRNRVGYPVEIDRSNSSFSHISYDKVYRTLEVHDNQVGSGDHLITKFNYTYNDVGHITQEIAKYGWRQPDLITTNYNYDGLHRLIDSTDDDDQSSQYSYDAAGNRLEMIEQLKKGPETRSYSYNEANQLLAVDIDSPMPPNVVDIDYQYDQNGNRIDKLVLDGIGVDRGVDYKYDYENRLLIAQDYQGQIVQDGGPEEVGEAVVEEVEAAVEPTIAEPTIVEPTAAEPTVGLADLALVETVTPSVEPGEVGLNLSPSPEVSSLEISPSPSLDLSPTITSDAKDKKDKDNDKDAEADANNNGNKPEKPEPGKPVDPVINDLAHTDLEYDGNGRRLVQTYYPGASQPGKRMEYVFDQLDPVVEYSMWNGQRNNIYRNSAQDLMFFQEFKSEQDPNGTIYFYHHDGEGNIAATTKHKAQSDHSYHYDEYGAIMPENGNWAAPHNQYTLTQKQYDANTNLYYFGARHYDAEVGVWLTQDTYRGQLPNPQSMHRYMYNYDSPVNYVDPDGRNPLVLLGISAVIDYGIDTYEQWQLERLEERRHLSPEDEQKYQDYLEDVGLGITVEQSMQGSGEMLGAATVFLPIDDVVTAGSSFSRKIKKPIAELGEKCDSVISKVLSKKAAIGATGELGEKALKKLGGESQKHFSTKRGARYVDQFVKGVAYESKVGYTTLTQEIQQQIVKDAELIKLEKIKGAVWHFFESPVTGKGGPSQPLREALESNGIQVIIE